MAVTVPTLTFNALQSCTPRFGPLRSRCGTGGSRRDGSYCRRVRHHRRPKPRSPPLAVLLRWLRAMARPPYRREAVGLDDDHVARIDVQDGLDVDIPDDGGGRVPPYQVLGHGLR